MRSIPVLALFALSTSAFGATLQVGPAHPYTTISDAIDAATAGDTIEVEAGDYPENVLPYGKDLEIIGLGGSAATTISAPSGTAVIVSGSIVTLSGFTILPTSNRGLSVSGYATFTGTDLVFSDQVGGYYSAPGIAIHAGYSDVTLTDCVFERNNALGSHSSIVYLNNGSAELVRVTFADNLAELDGTLGLVANDAVIDDCTFSGNTSTEGGALTALDGVVTVLGSTFTDNTSTGEGGAIALSVSGGAAAATAALDVSDSTFERNSAGGRGGAIHAAGTATVSGTGNTFCGNTSTLEGGAVSLVRGGTTTSAWVGNLFVDNAAQGAGGGLYVEDGGGPLVQDNTFLGNAGTLGGHVDAVTTAPVLVNNLFAFAARGDGIAQTDASGTRDYNLYFDNVVGDTGGGLTVSDLGANAVFADPLLVAYSSDGDCSNDDLQLWPTSPAVDAGDPSLLDLDGSPSDIGALGVTDATPPDADADGYDVDVDCDDTDPAVHPDAPESCNARDDDCDGVIDEDLSETWYADDDGDGFGVTDDVAEACAQPDGYTAAPGDCDDTDADVNPGAVDVLDDGIDQDCDGVLAERPAPADPGEPAGDEGGGDANCGCSVDGGTPAGLWGPASWLVRRRAAGARGSRATH